MSHEMTFANARIVTRDAVLHGRVHVRDGVIAAIDAGTAVAPGAIDCAGD